jgi:hypothetical protein
MWAKIGTAHLLVGLPRADDDDESGYESVSPWAEVAS